MLPPQLSVPFAGAPAGEVHDERPRRRRGLLARFDDYTLSVFNPVRRYRF